MGVNIEHRNAWVLLLQATVYLTLSPTLYICFVLPSRDMREASSY